MLNMNRKSEDLRSKARNLLDFLPKKQLEEAVDFLEFLKEKKELERPLLEIVGNMHKKAKEKGMEKITEEDIAEIIHKRRGVK